MKASYTITEAPANLGNQLYIDFLIDGKSDWNHARRAKAFYPATEEGRKKAEAAGKRYLKKMQENGFTV